MRRDEIAGAETVDEVGMTRVLWTSELAAAPIVAVRRRFADSFSASEVRLNSAACHTHKQIHNSYGYCYDL